MSNTANLALPLVQAAQAQKHVTVNEALSLLDGLSQMTLEQIEAISAPGGASDGQAYALGASPTGAWAGQGGKIAVASNGGWLFVTPQIGWRGWVVSQGEYALFDGASWQLGAVAVSAHGAASIQQVVELDVDVTSGSEVTTAAIIPDKSVVFGVTGRVINAITGSASSWRLGIAGSTNMYGSGLGTGQNAWVSGLSGQPQAFYAPTPLVIGAEGGSFSGGRIRLAVHLFRMSLPRA